MSLLSPEALEAALRDIGARRYVLRRHIRVVERIQHRPQHVALELDRGEHGLLLGRGPRVTLDVVKREIGVASRLRRPLVEVGQRFARDETIARQHAFQVLDSDFRRLNSQRPA